jgi:hypothetical protein
MGSVSYRLLGNDSTRQKRSGKLLGLARSFKYKQIGDYIGSGIAWQDLIGRRFAGLDTQRWFSHQASVSEAIYRKAKSIIFLQAPVLAGQTHPAGLTCRQASPRYQGSGYFEEMPSFFIRTCLQTVSL